MCPVSLGVYAGGADAVTGREDMDGRVDIAPSSPNPGGRGMTELSKNGGGSAAASSY